MADEDPLAGAGTYSQLLFSGDDVVSLGTDSDGFLNFSSSPSQKMLCFGTKDDLRSGKVTCSEDSSSASSLSTNARNHKSSVINKKRNSNGEEKDSNSKKNRTGRAKREKLGDRIAALQQLVSPFGKGDTASVLHEAKGYIRFLQDQVRVLCSPYLMKDGGGGGGGGDIRSRGLCLVPIDLTFHSHNGADLWSPAEPPRRSN